VDTDSNRDVSIKYGINAIPTVILFKNGQVAQKFVGLRQERDFKRYSTPKSNRKRPKDVIKQMPPSGMPGGIFVGLFTTNWANSPGDPGPLPALPYDSGNFSARPVPDGPYVNWGRPSSLFPVRSIYKLRAKML